MFPRTQNEKLKKECIWVRIRGAFLAKKGAPKLSFHREGGGAVAPICPLNPPLILYNFEVKQKNKLHVFYQKLGCDKFLSLISNFDYLSTKGFLIGFLFSQCRIINVVANTAADMFLSTRLTSKFLINQFL